MDIKRPPKPDLKWLKLPTWHNIYDLSQNLPKFSSLCQDIESQRPIMIRMSIENGDELIVELNPCDNDETRTAGSDDYDSNYDPFEYEKSLSDFDKLILIRCFAESKIIQATTLFVAKNLGQSFIESPPTDLNTLFKDMSSKIPLVFILSTGSDPMGAFLRFAKEQGKHA